MMGESSFTEARVTSHIGPVSDGLNDVPESKLPIVRSLPVDLAQLATDPGALLRSLDRAAAGKHDWLHTDASAHMTRHAAYLKLGDLGSALRHALEAQRLVRCVHAEQARECGESKGMPTKRETNATATAASTDKAAKPCPPPKARRASIAGTHGAQGARRSSLIRGGGESRGAPGSLSESLPPVVGRATPKDQPLSTRQQGSAFLTLCTSLLAFSLAMVARQKDQKSDFWRISGACLYDMGKTEVALALFSTLADKLRDSDMFIVCARIHVQLNQLPLTYIRVNRVKELKPDHPGILPLVKILEEYALKKKMEAAQLSLDRMYAAVLDVVHQGLQVAPDDSDLLYHKAQALVHLGRAHDLQQFLATFPEPLRGESQYAAMMATSLELLVKGHRVQGQYEKALEYLGQIAVYRRRAVSAPGMALADSELADTFVRGELHFLLSALKHPLHHADAMPAMEHDEVGGELAATTAGARGTTAIGGARHGPAKPGPDPARRRFHADSAAMALEKFTFAEATIGRRDQRAAAYAMLSVIYAAQAVLQSPQLNDVVCLESIDKALAAAKLTYSSPSEIPPRWTAQLHLIRGRILLMCKNDKAGAAEAARHALRLRPAFLDAKKMLLEATGDQEEVAAYARSVGRTIEVSAPLAMGPAATRGQQQSVPSGPGGNAATFAPARAEIELPMVSVARAPTMGESPGGKPQVVGRPQQQATRPQQGGAPRGGGRGT